MKKFNFNIFACALLCLTMASCSYGPYLFNFGQVTVDERSGKVEDITGTTYAPLTLVTDEEFSFIVFTDLHFGKNFAYDEDAFVAKFESLYEADPKPSFAVGLGDLTDNGSLEFFNRYVSMTNRIKSVAEGNGKDKFTTYSIMGNHDLYNMDGEKNFKEKVFPYSSYMFTVNGVSFYFLDTANSSFGKKQLSSLKSVMGNDANPKLVFTHVPQNTQLTKLLMSDPLEQAEFLTVCAQNNVKQLLEGHTHENFTCNYGQFTEQIIPSYLTKRSFCVVTVKKDGSDVNVTTEIVEY